MHNQLITVVIYSPPIRDYISTICPVLETYYSEFGKFPDLVNWELPYIHYEPNLDTVVSRIASINPTVLGIGRYMWNEAQVDYVAKKVKMLCPSTIIVAGGPHQNVTYNSTPFNGREYLDAILEPGFYGEIFFTSILDSLAAGKTPNWDKTCGAIFKGPGGLKMKSSVVFNARDFVWPQTDYIERHNIYFSKCSSYSNNKNMFVSYETNRGCPYSCSFCEWGIGAYKKISLKPEEVVRREIFSLIKYTRAAYVVDANFGQIDRDVEFVELFHRASLEHNKPYNLRFAGWAKNKKNNLIHIYQLLLKSSYIKFSDDKGDVIAVQDFDPAVKAINNRTDLSFDDMIDFLHDVGELGHYPAPQLIIGMPGQTLDTHWNNIDIILNYFGFFYRLSFSLFCLLPDTPAADPAFISAHNIKTRQIIGPNHTKLTIVAECNTFSFIDLLEMQVSLEVLRILMGRKHAVTKAKIRFLTEKIKQQQFFQNLVESYLSSTDPIDLNIVGDINYVISSYIKSKH